MPTAPTVIITIRPETDATASATDPTSTTDSTDATSATDPFSQALDQFAEDVKSAAADL